jgi:hypothetical protein
MNILTEWRRNEHSTSSGPGVPASRLWLDAVEQGMALRHVGTVFAVPRVASAAGLGSRYGVICLIPLDAQCAGPRSAGIPQATWDVARAGKPFTVRLERGTPNGNGDQQISAILDPIVVLSTERSNRRGASRRESSFNSITG